LDTLLIYNGEEKFQADYEKKHLMQNQLNLKMNGASNWGVVHAFVIVDLMKIQKIEVKE
jgi:hypothetical protein